jgi:acetyltransferase-like isoleucine patch superfamily enzyme
VAQAGNGQRVRKDHKPYSMRLLTNFLRAAYTRWYVCPQLDSHGDGLEIIGPHRLEIWGDDIHLGANVHIQTAKGKMSRLCTWPNADGGRGKIIIGDNVLLTPGLHIVSAASIEIGDAVMIASNVYISDADWHDIYDRTASPGASAPITLERNVWLGEGVKLCKGVRIGENSVIGAGSVVTGDIPANVIAGGNPARVIRPLEAGRAISGRETMFADRAAYEKTMKYLHWLNHKDNSFFGWLRQMVRPGRKG